MINIDQHLEENERDAVNIAACLFAREIMAASLDALSDSKIRRIVAEFWDKKEMTSYGEYLIDLYDEESVREFFIRRVIHFYRMIKSGNPAPPILILDDKERARILEIAQERQKRSKGSLKL